MRTTIQIDMKTKKALDKLKLTPKEPYYAVIQRLIKLSVDGEPLSKEAIREIRKALDDIEEGRLYSSDEARKRLGLI